MPDNYSFFDFFHETPLFFKIFFGFLLLFVIGTFLYIIIKGLTTWISNNRADVVSVQCRVVDKRTEVWGGSGESSATTNYYVTFESEDNTRKEFYVRADQFGLLVVGDRGELVYQGTRFLGFNRKIENH